MNTLSKRIALLRGDIPQAKFATTFGVAQNTIGRYERGESTPDADFLLALRKKLGVSSEWLLTGEGPMRAGELDSVLREDQESYGSAPRQPMALSSRVVPGTKTEVVECMDCHLAMIPMVEARLSAGTGSFENGGDSDRRYAFRTDFLSRKGQIAQMVLMRVSGDSMEPEIYHNDVVLIDQSQTTPQAGTMFAVAVEDMVYIKMVDALPGKIVLKSCNPAYAPLEIDTRGDLADGIRIVGKAIWMGREMK